MRRDLSMRVSNILKASLVVVFGLALVGCSGMGGCDDCGCGCGCEPAPEVAAPQPVFEAPLTAELPAEDAFGAAPEAVPCDVPARPAGMPADARAGEAWCKFYVPPKYETVTKRVLVKPACSTKEWVPAKYEERTKKVCSKPASSRRVQIPGEFETRTERVLVRAAREEWQKIDCDAMELEDGEKQGECWRLVKVPAEYKSVTKKVCVKEPSCRVEEIPAEYKTVTEKVMVKAGYYKEIPVEAVYKTVEKKQLVAKGRWEWRKSDECLIPDVIERGVATEIAPAPAAPMPALAPVPGMPTLEAAPVEDVDLGAPPAGRAR